MSKKVKVSKIMKLSKLVAFTDTLEELDKLAEIINTTFERETQIDANHLSLKYFVLDFCGKIQSLSNDYNNYPQQIKQMIQIFNRKNLLSSVYQQIFKGILEEDSTIKNQKHFQPIFKQRDNFDQTLNLFSTTLTRMFKKAQTKKNKLYFYSIIDLEGNFFWMDNKSQKKFSTLSKKCSANFFNLLIPFSKNYLKKKYQQNEKDEVIEIFNKEQDSDYAVLSYIIYSKLRAQAFIDQLEKSKSNIKQVQEDLANTEKQTIYYRYLEGFCSKFTIKNFYLDREDVQFFQNNEEMKFIITPQFQNAFDRFENEPKLKEINLPLIYMETRPSKSIPLFDFSIMKEDPKIQELQQYVLRRLERKLK